MPTPDCHCKSSRLLLQQYSLDCARLCNPSNLTCCNNVRVLCFLVSLPRSFASNRVREQTYGFEAFHRRLFPRHCLREDPHQTPSLSAKERDGVLNYCQVDEQDYFQLDRLWIF
ncbi:uncharacterized protein [Macrobrachium rosenbergii]|uniref:uncharacterized protein isoform X2 n=1 Tax=Macrobrachium rosenbergii TaxID=79674 RepID=UPI0034D3D11B